MAIFNSFLYVYQAGYNLYASHGAQWATATPECSHGFSHLSGVALCRLHRYISQTEHGQPGYRGIRAATGDKLVRKKGEKTGFQEPVLFKFQYISSYVIEI
jgi:hypothetical protein